MSSSFKMVAKTLLGLEDLLVKELEDIGAQKVKPMRRAISFEGDDELMYKANYQLRTAIRILKPLHEFKFTNVEDFYDKLYNFEWAKYMDLNDTFAIDKVVYSSKFDNTQFAVYKFKDAICDYFVRNYRRRPSVNTQAPNVKFNLHVSEDRCIVSLDSSLDSLHKRGYRFSEGLAPINEVLAAAMLKFAGWDGKQTLIDPMCGSGTILIEAIMLARNIPAGYYRDTYGFQSWKNFDKELWEKVKREADQRIKPIEATIIGADINREVLRAVRVNLRRSKLHMNVKTLHTSFEDFNNTFDSGLVITNPPYGERIGAGEIAEIYNMIGSKLKNDFQGFDAWIITAPKENFKHIGLRPSEKITLLNGQLEGQLQHFELYEGSKKYNQDTPKEKGKLIEEKPRKRQEVRKEEQPNKKFNVSRFLKK
ncbi:putative N6-adenine-specific DNA methylase [Balneicella halophila]|uniref:Putative N6-adenine-specific DNA methylase n=1 Tax=Balneicella halophila TaxID=1537566 RepID=A0A7L4UNC1_BALHA|nr:THUMP domain-containing protein [Balneicella halophila]PVX50039.1 putative N6-adenine-specific DNA methylase [Balneicella halophila]